MSLSKVFPVLLQVLKNQNVIIAFAVVILYWCFFSFVLYYRKRPPKPKEKKPVVAAAPAPAEGDSSAEGEAAAAPETES